MLSLALPFLIVTCFVAGSAGIILTPGGTRASRWLHSAVAGMLAGLVLFRLLPGALHSHGIATALFPALCGFALFLAIDRALVPICSTCSDNGSLWPLVVLTGALGVHAWMDGALLPLGYVYAGAVILHRLPEAMVAGFLLRSAAPSRSSAMAALGALQLLTLGGAATSSSLAPETISQYSAIGVGCLIYLAAHRLHEQYRHSPETLWLAGIAAASMLGIPK